ncbi:universal stress protein YxiE-like [Mytilus edulis]|uniref:universal stress protein YxiE-like n=1 Tax=Mytilus edulis TaxID=6550 RepID=UPI0039EE7931
MEEKYRTVLLAMDGSDHSDHAYRWYLKYLRQASDYVVFVHCPELTQSQLSCFISKCTHQLKTMMLEHEQETRLLLARLHEHLKRENISGKVVRKLGDPREQILKVANEENVDCIVTGSRGRNKTRLGVMGSVSSFLVHHSKVPVLIVKKDLCNN